MKRLIRDLREASDGDFLQDAELVVAHVVRKNNFLESYRLNFLLNTTESQDVDRMVEGVGTGSVCAKKSRHGGYGA